VGTGLYDEGAILRENPFAPLDRMLDEGRGSQVPVELGGDIDSCLSRPKAGMSWGTFVSYTGEATVVGSPS